MLDLGFRLLDERLALNLDSLFVCQVSVRILDSLAGCGQFFLSQEGAGEFLWLLLKGDGAGWYLTLAA